MSRSSRPRSTRRLCTAALGVVSFLTVSAFPAGASGAAGANATNVAASLQVRTTGGLVQGATVSGDRVFQGIPYAAPPTGAQRWRPPQPAGSWSGVRDATKPGNECVQQAIFWRPGSPASWNEDCLNLNVWTPGQLNGNLPVLVWFHGGGFVNGAGTDVQPQRLTTWGNNIVVTVNYRLGAMGGLALPQLDAESSDGQSSGNYGMLDQQAALRWIRSNIAAFGGNPAAVTIAGQSAGAGAVCYHLASPTAAGLFQRAIIQSGLNCQIVSHAAGVTRGTAFATRIGCTDAATLASCLRSKTPAQIITAQAGTGWSPAAGGASQPLLPLAAFQSGRFNKVPVIIGNTRHEVRAFVYEGNDLVSQPLTAEGYVAAVQASYGANAAAVLAQYPLSAYSAPGIALAAVQTDQGFACPTLPIADALSQQVRTYAYEFRDETSPLRPYMVIPPSFPIGSGHTADVPYVWQSATMTPLTSTQLKLSSLMIAYWSKFARVGDPNGGNRPGWPRVGPNDLRLGLLTAGQTEVITNYSQEHHCGFWQSMA